MAEYISKQRAKDLMGCCLASAKANYKAETSVFKKAQFQDYINTIEAMIDVVGSVEAADVQPVKHGRWIEKPPYKDETVRGLEFQIVCSECDEQNCSIEFDDCYNPIGKTFYRTPFCPNCGANMRGDTNDKT